MLSPEHFHLFCVMLPCWYLVRQLHYMGRGSVGTSVGFAGTGRLICASRRVLTIVRVKVSPLIEEPKDHQFSMVEQMMIGDSLWRELVERQHVAQEVLRLSEYQKDVSRQGNPWFVCV